MDTVDDLNLVLRRWTEVFMHRSMKDFREFSRRKALSIPQLGALFYVSKCHECGVSDLGDHLGVTNAAASQHIDRLVQLGLLSRTEDPHDRRNKTILLTPGGQALIDESLQSRCRWLQGITHALTAEQQQAISAALAALTEAALEMETQEYTLAA